MPSDSPRCQPKWAPTTYAVVATSAGKATSADVTSPSEEVRRRRSGHGTQRPRSVGPRSRRLVMSVQAASVAAA
jgi:hypothetical protein